MTQMVPDPVEARADLMEHVERTLRRLEDGTGPERVETEKVDLKEEAGRRDRTGGLIAGSATNPAAAEHLAGEIRCFANTPGGGAIVLGIDDKNLSLLGTALDAEWLRQRLDVLTGIAPVVLERRIRGVRLLLVLVAESTEPVEDPDRRLRWRVGDRCTTVDRAEWWSHRAHRIGVDPMAAPTSRRPQDISGGALATVRTYLRQGGDEETAAADDDRLLVRLGVLLPDRALTQAGVLLLCPASRPLIELSRLDVAGGEVIGRYIHPVGTSLVQALHEVEARLDAINGIRPRSRGFVESGQRTLPVRAVREAILNHLIHRDWMHPEATTVRWIDADDTLEVTSPGGFTGGVRPHNVLTTRHSRYPALADLFRALRLVDKQGVGVPRMFQTMLSDGHQRPVLEDLAGPRVRTILPGLPLVPVLAGILSRIEPAPRRRDVHVAVLLDALMQHPFLTDRGTAQVLQRGSDSVLPVLAALQECRVDGLPVVERFPEGWRLNAELADRAVAGRYGDLPVIGDYLWFRGGGSATVRRVAQEWLAEHPRLTSGQLAGLTGAKQSNVSRVLAELADVGDVVARGPGRGRSAHFVAAGPCPRAPGEEPRAES